MLPLAYTLEEFLELSMQVESLMANVDLLARQAGGPMDDWPSNDEIDEATPMAECDGIIPTASTIRECVSVVQHAREIEEIFPAFEPAIIAATGGVEVAEFGDYIAATSHGVAVLVVINLHDTLARIGGTRDAFTRDKLTEREYWRLLSRMLRERSCLIDRFGSESDQLVSIAQLEKLLCIGNRALQNKKDDWPPPAVPNRGSRGARWPYRKILPKLREQFPDKHIPDWIDDCS